MEKNTNYYSLGIIGEPMAMMEMTGIKRHYEMASGVVKALDGIDIQVEAGERLLIGSIWLRKNHFAQLHCRT